MMIARNSDLGSFTTSLGDLLNEPSLFAGMMHFLNRLLLIKDEKVWIKITEQLAQNTEFLLNSTQLTTTTKAQFVDFILQVSRNKRLLKKQLIFS